MYNYLVVGSGLYGAIFAHEAKKAGKSVLVIDKRPNIAGNIYTEKIEGINVHKYGAHIFHTNNKRVWEYITQFAEFNRFTNSPVANYKNTLSDNGGVTRGICKMDAENNLTEVVETKNIIKTTEGAEADGMKLDIDSLVSMNMWGLTPDFLKTLEEGFKEFFEKEVPANPLKAEYLIPTFIGELLSEGKISVKALRTNDTWYGMTYKEDVAAVKESFSKMLENGTYKGDLFSDL